MPESNSELHQFRAHWSAVPLPGETVPLASIPAALSDGVMALSELTLAYATGLTESFEILGSAVVILDPRGRVIAANQKAKATLTTELRIVRGRLIATDSRISKRIGELLDQVMSSREGGALGTPLAVPRLARRPLVLYPLRLVGKAQDRFSPARALIIIVDLETRAVPAEAHLQQIFGLTSAESRLVGRLCRGETLEAAADLLHVTKETARTQLKAVFAKTETARQSELMALIARLLGSRVGI